MKENKTTFFDRLRSRLAPSDLLRVRLAYYMAKFGHRAQLRKEINSDGENVRYFEHVRRVAIVLMDEFEVYDPDLVITALLHDALEDTDAIDAQMIELSFGPKVASYVTFLTKVQGEGDAYIKRIRSAPINVKLVKIADRIDNLRSLHFGSPAFQQKQLLETKEKYLNLMGHKFDSENELHRAATILHETFYKVQDSLTKS